MDWFDKNATALIPAGAAILSVFIAGGLNLLNNVYNNKIIQSKILRDESKDSKRLYLEKGEELHGLLTKWGNLAHASFLYDLAYISGDIDQKYNNVVSEKQFDIEVFTRISALINIYFPLLVPEFESARSSAHATINSLNDYIRDNSLRESSLSSYNQHVNNFHHKLENVIAKLQKELLSKLSH